MAKDMAKTSDISVDLFSYEDALQMLRRGKKLTRDIWKNKQKYIRMINEKIYIHANIWDPEKEYTLTDDDKIASDWRFLA